MTPEEISTFESKITEVLKKNFSRQPSPHEKSYDSADFVLMGKDVSDAILADYFVQPHPSDKELMEYFNKPRTHAQAVDDVMAEFDKLRRTLNDWVYGKDGVPEKTR